MPGFDSNITNYAHTGAALQVNAPGGDALSSLAQELGAGFGNIAGNGVNYLFNSALQNQQFQNQQALQKSAFRMNQKAVQQQARLQAIGMQQAGLSPAGVAGTGAPSLQSGAAAGATSGMSNIFSGLAEIIAAAKLPSDLSKIDSEVLLNRATAGKVGEEAEQIQHANTDWTTYNAFMREHGPNLMKKQIEALQDTVTREWTDDKGETHSESLWDFLSHDTQQTYLKLANGDIPLTAGVLKAINDDMETQARLAELDDRQGTAMTHLGLLIEKLQDPKALDALLSEEKNKVRQLEQDIKESKSRATSNYANARLSNAEAQKKELTMPDKDQGKKLAAAEIELLQTQIAEKIQSMDQAALQDFAYLMEQGRYLAALGRLGINATDVAIDVVKSVGPWALASRGIKFLQFRQQKPTPPPPQFQNSKMFETWEGSVPNFNKKK